MLTMTLIVRILIQKFVHIFEIYRMYDEYINSYAKNFLVIFFYCHSLSLPTFLVFACNLVFVMYNSQLYFSTASSNIFQFYLGLYFCVCLFPNRKRCILVCMLHKWIKSCDMHHCTGFWHSHRFHFKR